MERDNVTTNLIIIIIILIIFFSCLLINNINKLLQENNHITITETNKNDKAYTTNGVGSYIKNNSNESLEDSNIDYIPQNFNKTFYPYYQMLNSSEQDLYNQLYANINSYSTTFIPRVTISISELKNAFESIYNDHPELFWLDSSYSYRYNEKGNVIQIVLNFNNTIENINVSKTIFDNKVNEILNGALRLETDYEKEKYVHDYLINKIEYDFASSNSQSAYSALVNYKTVCAGYARAFQLVMIKLGIPTYYVTGYSESEDHAWNMVLLDDGYYNVDLTWDDTINSYYFFNITDTLFSNTHIRSNLSINLPPCNAIKYSTYNYYPTNVISKDNASS